MLARLQQTYDFLFGCWRRRLTRPFTISGETCEVCLTCGRKPSYSLDTSERKFEQMVGGSSALEYVLQQVRRVAPTDSTALILGETGTGKELIARAIHNISDRRGRPFIKL